MWKNCDRPLFRAVCKGPPSAGFFLWGQNRRGKHVVGLRKKRRKYLEHSPKLVPSCRTCAACTIQSPTLLAFTSRASLSEHKEYGSKHRRIGWHTSPPTPALQNAPCTQPSTRPVRCTTNPESEGNIQSDRGVAFNNRKNKNSCIHYTKPDGCKGTDSRRRPLSPPSPVNFITSPEKKVSDVGAGLSQII